MYIKIFSEEKSLPLKLTGAEFLQYYEEFKKGNMKAREKLIEHNLRFLVKMVNKILNQYSIADCYYDDVISAAQYGLIKSVDTFKLEKKVEFSTYAGRVIKNEVFMFLRQISKYSNDINLETPFILNEDGTELIILDVLEDSSAEFEEKIINKRYNAKVKIAMKKILSEREYEVICYLYGFNGDILSQKTVSEILGLDQSSISKIEKRALVKLKRSLDRNICEVEDYQNNFREFDVHSKNESLDPDYNKIKTPIIVDKVSDKAKKKVKRGSKSNSKNILTELTREDLLWSINYLNKHQLEILHIRHGDNLDMVLEWPEIPKEKKENYYFYSYYNICKKIHTLLENRTNLQLTKSKLENDLKDTLCIFAKSQEKLKVKDTEPQIIPKKKKIKLEEDQSQSISKKRAILVEQQKNLETQKENNLKMELYNHFYTLYGEIFSSEELENIIYEVISSYIQDEAINIKYFCQFKIEAIILKFLANKYKLNPDSEESLNILMHINSIFVKKMKTKYPFIQDSRIEIAIEEVLNNYEVEKIFSVELMKILRQMK